MNIKVKATQDLLIAIGGTIQDVGKPVALPFYVVEAIIHGRMSLTQVLDDPIKFVGLAKNTDIIENKTHDK